jgi:hypothetical protein
VAVVTKIARTVVNTTALRGSSRFGWFVEQAQVQPKTSTVCVTSREPLAN